MTISVVAVIVMIVATVVNVATAFVLDFVAVVVTFVVVALEWCDIQVKRVMTWANVTSLVCRF